MDLSYEALRKYEFSIHDPVTKILIPVRNSVDSRIGQFALSHGLSASGFDQLLELLNDPDIRTAELTFKTGADLERLAAKHRKNLQHRTPNSTSGFPLVVLEGVIDTMRLEMGTFVGAVASNDHLATAYQEKRIEFRKLIRSLRNMSLVHRSWLPLVHSLLHMRYCCTNGTIPRKPSRPVALAIRELAVDYNWGEDSSLRLLNNLLLHLPNLRSLSIGMTNYASGKYEESMRLVIGTIGRLTNLEVLLFPIWRAPELHYGSQENESTPYLFELCEALSNLKRLSTLWLSGLQCSKVVAETQLTEKLRNLKAPNIKTLILNTPHHLLSLPGHFLHWIIHSQDSPSLENLIISPDCLPNNADITIACSNGPGFSNLKRLFLASSGGTVYNAVYPLAQNIEVLYLNMIKDELPKRLPLQLKELIIQVGKDDMGKADQEIVALLERSGTEALEKITLKGLGFFSSMLGFSHVSRFCGTSVKLSRGIRETNIWAGFVDLIQATLP